jgi:hypothetical protein
VPKRTLLLVLAFLLAVTVTFVFGYRVGRRARYLRRPQEPIHSWMSVPFIAHARHVPVEILFEAIAVQPRPHDRRPLRRIAREQKRPVEELIRDLDAAIARSRGLAPAPPPDPARKVP